MPRLELEQLVYSSLFTEDGSYVRVDGEDGHAAMQSSIGGMVGEIDGLQTIVCDDVERSVLGVSRLLSNEINCVMLGMHFGRKDVCQVTLKWLTVARMPHDDACC